MILWPLPHLRYKFAQLSIRVSRASHKQPRTLTHSERSFFTFIESFTPTNPSLPIRQLRHTRMIRPRTRMLTMQLRRIRRIRTPGMLRRVHLRHVRRRGPVRRRRDGADGVLAADGVGICGCGLCEVLLGLHVLLLLGLLGHVWLLLGLLHVLLLLLDGLSILLLRRLLRLHWSGGVVVFLHGHGLVVVGAVLGWGLCGVCGGAVGGGLAVLVPCDEEYDRTRDPRNTTI
jgi:hypothetical protein